jgi:hypothetical protein
MMVVGGREGGFVLGSAVVGAVVLAGLEMGLVL